MRLTSEVNANIGRNSLRIPSISEEAIVRGQIEAADGRQDQADANTHNWTTSKDTMHR